MKVVFTAKEMEQIESMLADAGKKFNAEFEGKAGLMVEDFIDGGKIVTYDEVRVVKTLILAYRVYQESRDFLEPLYHLAKVAGKRLERLYKAADAEFEQIWGLDDTDPVSIETRKIEQPPKGMREL